MTATTARRVTVPQVKLDGAPLPAEWAELMTSVVLEMALQLPSRLTMRFFDLSDERGLDLPLRLGTKVSVSFPPAEGDRHVELGKDLLVTEVALERDQGGTPEIVVVAEDAAHILAHTHRVATYLEMTASQVVEKVAATVGLAVDAEATSESFPYLLQSDSDMGFVSTLARRCGYDWWVEGTTLHFARPPSSPTIVETAMHEDLLQLSVRASSIPSKPVRVKGWDSDRKESIEATAPVPGRSPVRFAGATGSALGTATELPTAQVRPTSTAEAQSLAAAIAARQSASATEADGEMYGNPTVVPRTTIRVKSRALEGDFSVTRCEHRFTATEGYTTRFMAGDRVPSSLADLLGGGTPGAHSGAYESFPHVSPAVVTSIGTGENLGRVKVMLPYMSDADESHWARVVSAGGGPERGFWFLPEIEDEVLVAFEGGDPRFPVVLGGLYGKVSTPESQLIDGDQVTHRAVRSRLGHVVEMADGRDDKTRHVLIGLGKDGKSGTDYRMRLGEDRFDLEVPSGKPIAIKSGTTQITLTDKGAIEIKGDKITIEAQQTLDLKAQQIKIASQMDVAVSSPGGSLKSGPGGVEVDGKPMTKIKGAPQVMIG